MTNSDGTLGEREIAHLLKRIDRLVPLEESERMLLRGSRNAVYGRVVLAVLWVLTFGLMWGVVYYTILAENSESMSYILPRLSASVGMMSIIVFMRLTDRLKLSTAMIAGVIVLAFSRMIA